MKKLLTLSILLLVLIAGFVLLTNRSNRAELSESGVAAINSSASDDAEENHNLVVSQKGMRPKKDVRSLVKLLGRGERKGKKTIYTVPRTASDLALHVRQGAEFEWSVVDGFSYEGIVESVSQDGDTYNYSVLLANGEGRLTYQRNLQRTSVRVFYNGKQIAHRFMLEEGKWQAIETTVSGLRCARIEATYPVLQAFGKPLPAEKQAPEAQYAPPSPNVIKTATQFQSKTDGVAVIYLDFDGEVVNDPNWYSSTVNAAASTLTAEQIIRTCQAVAEDYITFDVNVTNVRSVYDATPSNKRIMCITTPTDTVSPGSGGVAFLNSFVDDVVCWNFINGKVADAADTISHEVGHTVGLDHDGVLPSTEYYDGHSNGQESWAPIMGGGYGISLSQWSKGGYYQSRNVENEDDFLVMSQTGLSYRPDDYGNTAATAHAVSVNRTKQTIQGFIGHGGDKDVFSLTFDGLGALHLFGGSYESFTNLDLRMTVKDSSGATLADYTGDEFKTARDNLMLQPGTYEITLEGDSTGSPMSSTPSGWDSYGSVGAYNLTFDPVIINTNTAIENSASISNSGTRSWFLQELTTNDGVDALQSGNIGNSESSIMEMSATTTSISFFYKVSSEQTYDFFEFYIDGVRVLNESGEIDWTQYSNSSLSNSTHTFRWVFKKDYLEYGGSDAAYLDQVVFGDTMNYSLWANATGALGAQGNDTDGDNYPNLMEYAAGSQPNSSSSTPAYCLNTGNLSLEFNRNLTRPDLISRLFVSNNLSDWDLIGVSYGGGAFYMLDSHSTTETPLSDDLSKMQYDFSAGSPTKAFGRLEFETY